MSGNKIKSKNNLVDNAAEHTLHGRNGVKFVEKQIKRVDVWRVKPYECKTRIIDIKAGKRIVMLNQLEAQEHDIYSGFRTEVEYDHNRYVAIVDVTKELVKPGEAGIFCDVADELGIKNGQKIKILHMDRPESVEYIRKKMDGASLSKDEINTIVKDIMDGKLSEVETSAWVSSVYIKGLSDDEIISLTDATVNSGDKLNLHKAPICDKHCVPGDTPTMVTNSGNVKVENIGDIVEKIFERCDKKDIEFDGAAYFTEKKLKNLHAMTYDERGEVKFAKVSAVYKLRSPRYLYQLTLLGNREVKATENHTVFALKNGKIVNIPIQKITENDYVLVPAGLKRNKIIDKIEIQTDFGIKNTRNFEKNMKITPEFMRFLGYFVSEGFVNYQGVFLNFGSHEKKLINDAIYCAEKVFGFKPTLNKPHETAVRVCLYSQTLAKIFQNHIHNGKKAYEKRIPSFVFQTENSMALEFLRALFNGDGYVRRGYEAIYVTASKKLATDVQYLLSTLGASVSLTRKPGIEKEFPIAHGRTQKSKTRESFYIYTQAREIFGHREKANVSFLNLLPIKELGTINKEEIGWVLRKALKNQKYMTKQKLSKIIKYVESEDTRKIITGKLAVLKVKEVKRVKSTSDYVYDFRIDGYSKFMAGSAPICIHNCVGGVAGNRTTMVVVPIIAAAKAYIPKTSSRSITSAAGTADVVEVIADVTFDIDELREIVKKSYGCMVWGGGLKLAPVDDKLIRIRHPLSLDPEGMLLASILAKKKSVGAEYVLIDIPVGRSAKVPFLERGQELARHFLKIGDRIGMKIEALITDGAEPVGNGIGPGLECRDVFEVLEGKGPEDLRHKSCMMAGKLLELSGKCEKDMGYKIAASLVDNGKALAKMREIVELQGGNKAVKSSDMPIGKYTYDYVADMGGQIFHIDNKTMSKIARIAGAPNDKGAGVYLYRVRGDRVEKGQKIFTIHAESEQKLGFAIKALEGLEPIEMRKMLLGTMV